MTERPTGTVTFLFTDIEGSTRLWEDHPVEMREALERHDEILRAAIDQHGGYVFSTAGDGFAAAFGRCQDALRAVGAARAALHVETWPEPVAIRVRMGLHVGEPQERNGDYFGPVLNRAARIMAAGHGGQVLVSAAVADLAERVGFLDLGSHRLKDLSEPERIWQLGDDRFGPLRTLEAVRHNLPVQRTLLVGRENEIAQVTELIQTNRLVTLVGVGGAGKTRLALAVAGESVDRFADGVFFVDFTPLSDPDLVVDVVADAIGLMASDNRGPALARHLGARNTLLVLDNCEHLIDEIADLVDRLLEAGDGVRVLATSREDLQIEGEHTFRVPSLSMQSDGSGPSVAAQLLIERAHAAGATSAIDDAEPALLESLTSQLDGIPLALELAAAQLAHMSVAELAARLDQRFELLVGGRRRRRQRQQTLQAVMDWSWELLHESERTTLAQLSVFTGGCDLDAAEAVCTPKTGSVPVVLGSLVAKSLVTTDETAGRTRYRLLETVRLYGQQKLVDAELAQATRDAHLAYYVGLLDYMSFEQRYLSHDAAARYLTELANYRTAAEWAISAGRTNDAVRIVTGAGFVARNTLATGDLATLQQRLSPTIDTVPDRLKAEWFITRHPHRVRASRPHA